MKFMKNKRFGFTIAEILIVLGIIGFVAAMTIPAVVNSYTKYIYVTRLKTTKAKIISAFEIMMEAEGIDNIYRSKFVKSSFASSNEIKKYFKVVELPTISQAYKTLLGDYTSPPYGTGLHLADGTYISFNGNKYYYDYQGTTDYYSTVFIDVNDKNPPNVWGRDTFAYFIKPNGDILPWGYVQLENGESSPCTPDTKPANYSLDFYCAARIEKEGWKMNY